MKALIIGLGSIARKHVDALLSLEPECEIYALRSSADAPGYPPVKNLYDPKALSGYGFDFALICSPTSEHRKSIELLEKLQIPLFIEKPLFHSLDIKDTVERIVHYGIPTYVGCNLRFLDALRETRRIVKELPYGRINEVNLYCGSYLPDWRKGTDFRNHYSTQVNQGGGVHIDLIHEIDYLYWMVGAPAATHSVFSNRSTLAIEAYDYANYCLEYPGFMASVILNYYRKDRKRTCEILFENQTLTTDLLSNTIRTSDGEVVFSSQQTIQDTYKDQMAYFLKLVGGTEKSVNSIADGYEVLSICLQ